MVTNVLNLYMIKNKSLQRRFLIAGAVFGLLGVVTGAFAAHGLRPLLDENSLNSFETGVRYQIYHALLFLILGSALKFGKFGKAVFYLLLFGVILFSGSIYVLATNNLTAVDFRAIALLTPLGGLLLIIAWSLLLVDFIKLKNK